MGRKGPYNAITDIVGIRVGHYTDIDLLTGVTVVLADEGSLGGVDVRGGSPGTRETDLLSPVNRIEMVNAVALCGSSAFGLDAVAGVMRFLEERGIGHQAREGVVVPIVPGAVIFDLGRGEGSGHLTEISGYRACKQSLGGALPQGNLGVGTGAVSGGLKGGRRYGKRGLGERRNGRGDRGRELQRHHRGHGDRGFLRSRPGAGW